VQSYEVGSKNNFNNRFRLASSIYYIKWHNIQQTVLPPVCQISWIQNLGEAVAKGADIQADWLVTPSLTAEFAAGYTDARYSRPRVMSAPTPACCPLPRRAMPLWDKAASPAHLLRYR